MKYCKRCVMPDTRPGIKFNENGVCYPCINHERRTTIDWKRRWKELKRLCDEHRKDDGSPDCIITASGGKDSHVQVKLFVEELGMHPMVVNISNLSWTRTGWANFNNLLEKYRVHCDSLHLSPEIARVLMLKAFYKYGSPTWFWDKCVYSYPLHVGIKWGIPLIVYGENIAYTYGGPSAKDTYSAKDQILNDVVKPVPIDEWLGDGITEFDMWPSVMPPKEEIEKLEPIYMSYFHPWDGFKNMSIASNDGFKTLGDTGEWNRQGYIEDYDQIDAPGYLVHPWLKYPKYGHARTTDVACNMIRNGYMTREYAIQLVKQHDHKLDPIALQDFLTFLRMDAGNFFTQVDKVYNGDLFFKEEQADGTHIWKLKNPIWEEEENGETRLVAEANATTRQ